jgi:N-methylhydantoinase A
LLSVGVDVGGTFTDVVAVSEDGTWRRIKRPSTPHAPHVAVIEALRELQQSTSEGVTWLGHATTIATNALLGQVGLELPRVAMITTYGFRDVIEIGRQNRSRIYDLFVDRPAPLVAREDRLTVRERVDHLGNVLEPLDDRTLDDAVAAIERREIQSVAVCLLHAYANPIHERRIASALRDRLGLECVAPSSSVDPEYREYERFSTTVVTAALAPIVSSYVRELEKELRGIGVSAPLYIMRSDGGMSEASIAATRPAALIESGPAGGVIAAAAIARTLGIAKALSFDMGGTTAKAGSIVDGLPEVANEYEAAGAMHSGRAVKGSGYPVRYPFIDLSEVSAGGGTIAWIDEAETLRVGPVSAGADPGPACYGRSDRATVTDANVVLGRLNQTNLLGGAFAIDAQRSREAIGILGKRIGLGVEPTAEGIVRIVDAQMAKSLRIVTIERGLDPREFTLVAFGGGGPLHACALAEELAVHRIVIPLSPGLLSAQGLLVADLSAAKTHPILRDVQSITDEELSAVFAQLESRALEELRAQGISGDPHEVRRSFDARYRGQSFELSIECAPLVSEAVRRFHDAHRARYGYAAEEEVVELVNARLTASARRTGRSSWEAASRHPERAKRGSASDVERSASKQMRRTWLDGTWIETPVFAREELEPGRTIAGPAIVEQYDTTTYVAPNWTATVMSDRILMVTHD